MLHIITVLLYVIMTHYDPNQLVVLEKYFEIHIKLQELISTLIQTFLGEYFSFFFSYFQSNTAKTQMLKDTYRNLK